MGGSYFVELLWTGFEPAKIPFDDLPSQWIVKANHGSGMNIMVRGEYDREGIIHAVRQWLATNFYAKNYEAAREFHYNDIKPRILIEHLLNDGRADGPLDYRFWCFGGQPQVIQVSDREHSFAPFYDLSWQKLPLRYAPARLDIDVQNQRILKTCRDRL